MEDINGKLTKLSWYESIWIDVQAHAECLPALIRRWWIDLKRKL